MLTRKPKGGSSFFFSSKRGFVETTAEGARENLEGPVGILLTQYSWTWKHKFPFDALWADVSLDSDIEKARTRRAGACVYPFTRAAQNQWRGLPGVICSPTNKANVGWRNHFSLGVVFVVGVVLCPLILFLLRNLAIALTAKTKEIIEHQRIEPCNAFLLAGGKFWLIPFSLGLIFDHFYSNLVP